MKRNNVLLGIVVYNENGRIDKVLEKVTRIINTINLRVVIVDDSSTDGSSVTLANFVKNHRQVVLIKHSQNSGVGKSIKEIISFGIKNDYEICVIMAGNGKDNPFEIKKLLKPILEDNYDYVQGSRFLDGGSFKNLPLARKFMIKGFTLAVGIFTGLYGTDASNGFRAYRLSAFSDKSINIKQGWLDRYELETYLHYKFITLGYRICEVPVSKNYLPHVRSYSKMRPVIDWWKMLRPLIFLKTRLKT